MRLAEIQNLIVARDAGDCYEADATKLTIDDGSFFIMGFLAGVGLCLMCLIVLAIGGVRDARVTLGLAICGLVPASILMFLRRTYEVRRGEIRERTVWWRLSLTRSYRCAAEDIAIVERACEDGFRRQIAILTENRTKALSLMEVNRLSFEDIRAIIRAYVDGIQY
jgi:hypothetical protein